MSTPFNVGSNPYLESYMPINQDAPIPTLYLDAPGSDPFTPMTAAQREALLDSDVRLKMTRVEDARRRGVLVTVVEGSVEIVEAEPETAPRSWAGNVVVSRSKAEEPTTVDFERQSVVNYQGSVPVKLLRPTAKMPVYGSTEAAGADLCLDLEDESATLTIDPGAYTLCPTGISLGLPRGLQAEVRPRSGLAGKHGVTVLNSPGTVDSDYRGEVKVILINHGSQPVTFKHGDRIAQLVISFAIAPKLHQSENLDETERGEGGFGSTGVASN